MKKSLLLLLLLACLVKTQNIFAQTTSIKTVYTEQKCDELIHRLTDSLMQITGDVAKNYVKINEMTNRVAHQFINEFEKDLGHPIKGDDLKFLIQQSKKCINEPLHGSDANLCGGCLGSGFRTCDYCHGRASEPCKSCNATGTILSNGYQLSCIPCQSSGYRNCLKCGGRGDIRCTTCNGSGHVK